jgi:drug/metabolite transporter (DMT)-like permease
MSPSVPPPPSPEQAQTQPRARRTERADPAHRQRAVAGLLLSVLSLFGLLGVSNFQRGVYIVGFALVAGALAIWLAGTALARTRRAGTAGPRGSVTAIVIGSIGVLLSGILLLGFALFGKQASTFSRCLSGANTIAAQQACQNQFIHSVEQVTP